MTFEPGAVCKAAVMSETEVASLRGMAFGSEMVLVPVTRQYKAATMTAMVSESDSMAMVGLNCEVGDPVHDGL